MKEPNKIAIFTIDSLYSSVALSSLIPLLKDRIAIIYISKKYGQRRGTFYKQLRKNLSKSGLQFTTYLSLVFVLYPFFLSFFNFLNKYISYDRKIESILFLAGKYGIPVHETDDINNEESAIGLKKHKVDLIISLYFDQLIKRHIFDFPRMKAINYHPGKLPGYRGPFPTFWAIKHGENYLSATIHHIDDKFDTGEIIMCEDIYIGDSKSVLGADYRVFAKAGDLISKALVLLNQSKPPKLENKNGNYYGYPEKKHINDLHKEGRMKIFTIKEFFDYFI